MNHFDPGDKVILDPCTPKENCPFCECASSRCRAMVNIVLTVESVIDSYGYKYLLVIGSRSAEKARMVDPYRVRKLTPMEIFAYT